MQGKVKRKIESNMYNMHPPTPTLTSLRYIDALQRCDHNFDPRYQYWMWSCVFSSNRRARTITIKEKVADWLWKSGEQIVQYTMRIRFVITFSACSAKNWTYFYFGFFIFVCRYVTYVRYSFNSLNNAVFQYHSFIFLPTIVSLKAKINWMKLTITTTTD